MLIVMREVSEFAKKMETLEEQRTQKINHIADQISVRFEALKIINSKHISVNCRE